MISGAYGYTLTLCGWAKRVRGDEWSLAPGNVTVFRTGAVALNGFDSLAAKGLGTGYRVSEPALIKESIHRLLVRRCKPANVKAWAKVVPRPADWTDAE